jgi:hypothetical protein
MLFREGAGIFPAPSFFWIRETSAEAFMYGKEDSCSFITMLRDRHKKFYWQKLRTETIAEYRNGRQGLERRGLEYNPFLLMAGWAMDGVMIRTMHGAPELQSVVLCHYVLSGLFF